MREKVKPATAPTPEPNPFDEAERAIDDENLRSWRGEKDASGGVALHGVRQISVTWGEQVIQPIQYNGFRVGPLSMTADVLPHETPREAYARVWRILDDLAREQFDAALQNFIRNAKAAGQAVRSRAGS